MTRNERIAFTLLEVIDMIKEDNYNNQNIDNNEILPKTIIEPDQLLIESISELNNVTIPIALETKKIFVKKLNDIKKSVSAIARWYYKIEPEKKFQVLYNFLKMVDNTIVRLLLLLSALSSKVSYITILNGGRLNDRGYRQLIVITLLNFLIDTVKDMVETPIIIKYNVDEYYETIHKWAETTKELDHQISECEDPKVKSELIKLRDKHLIAYDKLNAVYDKYKNKV